MKKSHIWILIFLLSFDQTIEIELWLSTFKQFEYLYLEAHHRQYEWSISTDSLILPSQLHHSVATCCSRYFSLSRSLLWSFGDGAESSDCWPVQSTSSCRTERTCMSCHLREADVELPKRRHPRDNAGQVRLNSFIFTTEFLGPKWYHLKLYLHSSLLLDIHRATLSRNTNTPKWSYKYTEYFDNYVGDWKMGDCIRFLQKFQLFGNILEVVFF